MCMLEDQCSPLSDGFIPVSLLGQDRSNERYGTHQGIDHFRPVKDRSLNINKILICKY